MARERRSGTGLRTAARTARVAGTRAVDLLATAVMVVATLCAIVLALHIVFVVFDANPDNAIVVFVHDLSRALVWKFRKLFLLDKGNLRVTVNYGLAAIAYLVAGRIASRLAVRLT
ncbi:MAG: hypothetical protein ACRDN9_01990 [Streptosporangiaceae bacterium]